MDKSEEIIKLKQDIIKLATILSKNHIQYLLTTEQREIIKYVLRGLIEPT